MQANIFMLAAPVLLIMARKYWKKDAQMSGAEMLLRYAVYTLLTTLLSTVLMVLVCDAGTSFAEKADTSGVFLLKFFVLTILSVSFVGIVEYVWETGCIKVSFPKMDWNVTKTQKRWMDCVPTLLLCIVGLGMLFLNLQLVFDNVVWGDEAYSGNLVKRTMDEMLEIIYYEDPHPPLYYFWLKAFTTLFGHSTAMCHMASYVLFAGGIVFALTFLRKRMGKMAAMLYMIVSGMSIVCVEYNVEIRMYALAFFAVCCCYYSAYRMLCGGKMAWVTMVLWGLAAAYTHYYALLTVVIMMVVFCLVAIYRFGKKTWGKAIIAGILFIIAYIPWLTFLAKTLGRVGTDWWMDSYPTMDEATAFLFAGQSMRSILLPLLLVAVIILMVYETEALHVHKQDGQYVVAVKGPDVKAVSPELWAVILGILVVVIELCVAYGVCYFGKPVLARRYLYPLTAVILMTTVTGVSRVLSIVYERKSIGIWGKVAFYGANLMCVVIVCVLLNRGWNDYSAFKTESELQNTKTQETLSLIGEPDEGTVLVNYGVKHIGWTVLNYYYPENQVLNGNYQEFMKDDMWYFTTCDVSGEEYSMLSEQGYQLGVYGEYQLGKYTFNLYHFFK